MAYGPIENSMYGATSKYEISFTNTGYLAGLVNGSGRVTIDAVYLTEPEEPWTEHTFEEGEAVTDAMVQAIVDGLNSVPDLRASARKVYESTQAVSPTDPEEES